MELMRWLCVSESNIIRSQTSRGVHCGKRMFPGSIQNCSHPASIDFYHCGFTTSQGSCLQSVSYTTINGPESPVFVWYPNVSLGYLDSEQSRIHSVSFLWHFSNMAKSSELKHLQMHNWSTHIFVLSASMKLLFETRRWLYNQAGQAETIEMQCSEFFLDPFSSLLPQWKHPSSCKQCKWFYNTFFFFPHGNDCLPLKSSFLLG